MNTSRSIDTVQDKVNAIVDALVNLHNNNPAAADLLSNVILAVTTEAARSPRFASALAESVEPDGASPKRPSRRSPGPFDPFEVYSAGGEAGLRDRLAALSLEELRDIVAEHRMDHDRLAMKWKDTSRVVERILDRVRSRAAKGDAFRSSPEPTAQARGGEPGQEPISDSEGISPTQ